MDCGGSGRATFVAIAPAADLTWLGLGADSEVRKGLGDLPREPNLRRVSGDLGMDGSPSMVIKYNHGILNVAVATTNMSTATMTVMWFRKKLRQVGEGAFGRRGIPSNGGLTDLDAKLE